MSKVLTCQELKGHRFRPRKFSVKLQERTPRYFGIFETFRVDPGFFGDWQVKWISFRYANNVYTILWKKNMEKGNTKAATIGEAASLVQLKKFSYKEKKTLMQIQ